MEGKDNILVSVVCMAKLTDVPVASPGGEGGMRPPSFWPKGGKGGAHHVELQPLVFSGKVITLAQHTQQCITQVTKVTTNSQ